MKLKRQQFVSQGALIRLSEAVAQCWQQQDYLKVIEILEPGLRLDPTNHRFLLDLGIAHGMNRDFAAAERCFERSVIFSPRKIKTLIEIGANCQNFGRFDLAEKFLGGAIQETDVTADAFAKLAEVYERKRQLERAEEMLDRALALDKTHVGAALTRARLCRQTGRFEDAEKLLRALLDRKDCHPEMRVTVLYELGALLDRQARYDEAMVAWLDAKKLLLPHAAPSMQALKKMQAQVRQVKETVTAADLQRWANSSEAIQPRKNIALLCGYPRSGTTLLEQVLDSHPQIISAEETEILHEKVFLPFDAQFGSGNSISSILEATPASKLQQCRKNYFQAVEKFLGASVGERLFIDKNPSLTVLIPLVIRVFPEMKFLVAVRDPRDVCLSCFMQPQPINPASSAWLTLEETVTDYSSLMSLWLAMKARIPSPAIEVRYEDMVENLESVARRVLETFGLPWNDAVLRFDEHARGKTVKSPTYAEVTKPIFKTAIGRWKNYQKYFEPQLDRLRPFAEAFGYEA